MPLSLLPVLSIAVAPARLPRLLIACLLVGVHGHAAANSNAVDGYEDVQARFQSTYIWQRQPGFGVRMPGTPGLAAQLRSAPVFSLDHATGKTYTGSLTGYFGMRPWAGAEAYFNPEIAVGVPLTGDLVGLGGFYNGEITRAAGTRPSLYRQRLFLRQTWNRGGGTEQVESDFNTLGGSVDRNRFVLTVGNFSTLDIFDKNEYAGDPRRQFMNWGNMASSAFDYAADSRGFGWGLVGEWYQGDWAFRLGRMTGPVNPNGQPVDFNLLQHYGDQVELEHNHEIAGHAGAARLLMWRNRAKLATFADATRYGDSVGWKPGANGMQYILDVRGGEKIKYGAGINLEQAVSSDMGVYLRAMWADGKTETHAFGEVDRSVSTGISAKGARWGRPQDAVGASYLVNHLSPERRTYLARGGISFFIGDGWLNYKPEQIIELYYNANLAKNLWITANYQRIANPAYNADRGPVHIMGVRLHTEF